MEDDEVEGEQEGGSRGRKVRKRGQLNQKKGSEEEEEQCSREEGERGDQ